LLGIAKYFCENLAVARPDTVIAESEQWAAVASAVRERRASLGFTHTQVAADGRVSLNVWSLLENNKQTKYRRRTLVAVAKALQWPDDALLRILDGLEPVDAQAARRNDPDDGETVTLPAGLARRLRDATPDEMARLEAYLDGLFERRREG
jgi:transcriptional regulator with XRE-family HTH domain